jgi:hypothetical protein
MTTLPFLRPGVLHFLGSFFNLDETHLAKDPSMFCLTPQRVERGAKQFRETIEYDEKKQETGWEILHSALGIPTQLLKRKHNETDRNFVLRIWRIAFREQGMPLSLKVEKRGDTKFWRYHVSPASYEEVKQAMQGALDRIAQSPLAKTKYTPLPNLNTEMMSQDVDLFFMQRYLGEYLREAFKQERRILFLCAHTPAGRQAFSFLRRNGADPTFLVTTPPIGKETPYVQDAKSARVLLLGVDFVPLTHLPKDFDDVVLWNFPSILASMHTNDPLPDFLAMSRSQGRAQPPQYYSRLWKAADLFHWVREHVARARYVLATGVRSATSAEVRFLERLRGEVTMKDDRE